MTPPKKGPVHHGRVKMTANQVLELAEALRLLNCLPDAEVDIRMGTGRTMAARVSTNDGIALGRVECRPANQADIAPLSPSA